MQGNSFYVESLWKSHATQTCTHIVTNQSCWHQTIQVDGGWMCCAIRSLRQLISLVVFTFEVTLLREQTAIRANFKFKPKSWTHIFRAKMKVFILLFCILLFGHLTLAVKKSSKCSAKQYRRADYAVAKLISFGKHGRKFPEDPDNLKPFCE